MCGKCGLYYAEEVVEIPFSGVVSSMGMAEDCTGHHTGDVGAKVHKSFKGM